MFYYNYKLQIFTSHSHVVYIYWVLEYMTCSYTYQWPLLPVHNTALRCKGNFIWKYFLFLKKRRKYIQKKKQKYIQWCAYQNQNDPIYEVIELFLTWTGALKRGFYLKWYRNYERSNIQWCAYQNQNDLIYEVNDLFWPGVLQYENATML